MGKNHFMIINEGTSNLDNKNALEIENSLVVICRYFNNFRIYVVLLVFTIYTLFSMLQF